MLTAVTCMAAIGMIAGLFLSMASKKYEVEIDPREEMLLKALPMTNCGACGFPGCSAFAKAVINKKSSTNGCVAGGSSVTEEVSKIMGLSAEIKEKEVAVIICKGGKRDTSNKFVYVGVEDCKSAALVSGGHKACVYGCIGFGTCEKVCPFDAIHMNENDLPVVDEEKCTGCRICTVNCPKHIIVMLPQTNKVHIRCHSVEKGNITRKSCTVGCIACRKCVKVCPVNAIEIKNNLAVINPDLCTNCEDCVPECPTNTIEDYIPGARLCASEYKKDSA